MKAITRFCAFALAGALSLGGLAGCSNGASNAGSSTAAGSSGEQVSTELTDRQILDQIILANPNQNELDHPASMDITTVMSLGEELGELESTQHADIDNDPFTMHMTMDAMGMNVNFYGEKTDDGGFAIYIENAGQWFRQDVDASELATVTDPTGHMANLKELLDKVGDENINVERKGDSYVLTMDIPGEVLGDMIDQTLANQTGAANLPEDAIKVKTYKMEATYDADTFYATKLKMDVAFDIDNEGEAMTVTMKMDADIDNNPGDLSIEIPAEARNAPSMDEAMADLGEE